MTTGVPAVQPPPEFSSKASPPLLTCDHLSFSEILHLRWLSDDPGFSSEPLGIRKALIPHRQKRLCTEGPAVSWPVRGHEAECQSHTPRRWRGSPPLWLSPFFPCGDSSHSHTPSQLFGAQEITRARGILAKLSSISLSLTESPLPSPTPFHLCLFQGLIWVSGDSGSL